MDEHFNQANALLERPTPTEALPLLDYDLHFAAQCTAAEGDRLKQRRRRAVGLLRELKCRWRGVISHLRRFQPESIRKVMEQRDVGLVAPLIVLTPWPDLTYPFGLIGGLPAVGYAPNYGVFPVQVADMMSLDGSSRRMGISQFHYHVQLEAGQG